MTQQSETYPEAETVAQGEAALKLMLATPPKPHKASKLESHSECSLLP